MKVNDLIKKLQELQKQIGYDVEAEIYMEDINGTECGIDDINDVNISTDEHDEDPAILIAHFNKNKEE